MFLVKLLGLILVCLAIGVVLLSIASKFKKKDPKLKGKDWWVFVFGKNAENRWAKIFTLELAAIFIIACCNWGPALWLPEKHPTPKQRSQVTAEWNYFWYGTNVPASTKLPFEILDPTKPLTWRHGSWFWWGAFLVLLPSWFIFVCWAYSDDIIRIAEERREAKRKQREIERESEHKDGDKKEGDKHRHAKSDEDGSHFWKPDFWDIVSIGEMIARFVKDWKRK